MEHLPPATLAWLLGLSGALNLSVLAYVAKRNDAGHAKVATTLENHSTALADLKTETTAALAETATEMAVLRTHLFGATGTNGINSRVAKLEVRADEGEALHQNTEVRLALVESVTTRKIGRAA